jgi:hypothetical protein
MTRQLPHYKYKLKRAGNAVAELFIVGIGRKSYLWIGDRPTGCYATLSGEQTLRTLARSIVAELGPSPKRKAKR